MSRWTSSLTPKPPATGETTHTWIFREEFAQHGMDDIVTLTHRNVCKDGFAVTDTVDAGNSFLPCRPRFENRRFQLFQSSWTCLPHGKPLITPSKPCELVYLCHPSKLSPNLSFSERHHNTYLLFQSMHGTSYAHGQRTERSRLHRFGNHRSPLQTFV